MRAVPSIGVDARSYGELAEYLNALSSTVEAMIIGEKNVGMVDRVIRIVVGFFVLGFGARYLDSPLNLVVAFVGFVIIATGVIGTCTLYSLLGINTGAIASPKQAPAPKSRKKAKNA
jgi:hypothetical protein